jgi:hypothetical protein
VTSRGDHQFADVLKASAMVPANDFQIRVRRPAVSQAEIHHVAIYFSRTSG